MSPRSKSRLQTGVVNDAGAHESGRTKPVVPEDTGILDELLMLADIIATIYMANGEGLDDRSSKLVEAR